LGTQDLALVLLMMWETWAMPFVVVSVPRLVRFELQSSHHHLYRWDVYHSQSWVVYGIVLPTLQATFLSSSQDHNDVSGAWRMARILRVLRTARMARLVRLIPELPGMVEYGGVSKWGIPKSPWVSIQSHGHP